jgi:hypothetical protein
MSEKAIQSNKRIASLQCTYSKQLMAVIERAVYCNPLFRILSALMLLHLRISFIVEYLKSINRTFLIMKCVLCQKYSDTSSFLMGN